MQCIVQRRKFQCSLVRRALRSGTFEPSGRYLRVARGEEQQPANKYRYRYWRAFSLKGEHALGCCFSETRQKNAAAQVSCAKLVLAAQSALNSSALAAS